MTLLLLFGGAGSQAPVVLPEATTTPAIPHKLDWIEAHRLLRRDWPSMGLQELIGQPSEWTPEMLGNALVGMASGFRQFAQELALLLSHADTVHKSSQPLISTATSTNSFPATPDDSFEDWWPQVAGYSHDSSWDDDENRAHGGLAGAFKGVVFFQQNANNINVINGGVLGNIVQVGAAGAGIKFPNIFFEQLYNSDGTKFCPFPIGFMMPYARATSTITTNFSYMGGTWAVMDGTANSAGSGIDMRGMVPYGLGSSPFDTVGASISVALTVTISGSGTAALTVNSATTGITVATATTGATVASGTTGITVNTPVLAHSASSGGTTFDTGETTLTFGSTFTGQSAVTESQDACFDEVSPNPHKHEVSKDSVALALADHSATACSVTDGGHTHTLTDSGHTHSLTDGGHTHTGTVSISTIASGLSVGTPSVLRPAGKVIVWIERIA